jgi:hypothetical protein
MKPTRIHVCVIMWSVGLINEADNNSCVCVIRWCRATRSCTCTELIHRPAGEDSRAEMKELKTTQVQLYGGRELCART